MVRLTPFRELLTEFRNLTDDTDRPSWPSAKPAARWPRCAGGSTCSRHGSSTACHGPTASSAWAIPAEGPPEEAADAEADAEADDEACAAAAAVAHPHCG